MKTTKYEVRYAPEHMWDYRLDVPGYVKLVTMKTRLGAVIWLKLNTSRAFRHNYKIAEVHDARNK